MTETLPWPRQDAKQNAYVAEIIQDLSENSRGLFVPPYSSQLDIEVAELSSRGIETFCFNSEGGLREHLSIYHDPAAPNGSGDEDSDDKDEELKASIIKDFPRDEGFAGFDSDITLDSSGTLLSFELCYMLKYVARREDATPGTNPWSIRHALIHQKYNLESKRASNIVIRLPERVKDALGDLEKEDDEMGRVARDWTWLHIACFNSVDHDMRQFINYLDEEITKVFDRVIMSGVEPTKLNQFDSVEQTSKDLKTLQYLSDQSRRLINVIELNMETIKCLQNEAQGLGAISSLEPSHRPPVEVLSNMLEKAQKEHRFSLKNASALRDAAALRNSEITNLVTKATAKLAEQSSRETHVVKTLTVLALIFVPASFVADFLQMGFVTIASEEPMRWAATADLKIYATLAIPLITVTMLIYACVEIMQRKIK
ncbi:hypothetical protein CDV31_016366 [Fusarium ambrosium]|uniref:CorA-like transporter domain-containing protein n=1 Tax=Fusarium ambrosium TaxID=131363 RepID=A0A428SA71_9HYPO|nr:hypothetical protein CDV31_016366 [Fusarium ambrosium]